MSALETAVRAASVLSPGDKAELLRRLAVELGEPFPAVERRLGVCGGDACIVNTRIPIWSLVRGRQLGARDDELLRWYPSLRLEDLANAWAYYDAHREDIDRIVRENEEA